jgi:hypothetical protein
MALYCDPLPQIFATVTVANKGVFQLIRKLESSRKQIGENILNPQANIYSGGGGVQRKSF